MPPPLTRARIRHPRWILQTILKLAGCLLSILATQASNIVPLPVSQLERQAELVVHGRVASVNVDRDPDGRLRTCVNLDVLDVWKGIVNRSPLRIVHGGGTLGNRRIHVSGQVEYSVGEEVVAFLVRNSTGDAVTVALAQGKFHVHRDAQTSESNPRLSNPNHPAARNQTTRGNPKSTHPPNPADSLQTLRDYVHSQVAGQRLAPSNLVPPSGTPVPEPH